MRPSTSQTFNFLPVPTDIHFGCGVLSTLPDRLKSLGAKRPFLVTDAGLRAAGLVERVETLLASGGLPVAVFDGVKPDSGSDLIGEAASRLRASEADAVVGLGGGSSLDTAKAVAAMATNCESLTIRDYLENVGRGLKLTAPPLPVLAMPTTAGTGAEATRNAVISSYDPPFKKSLRDTRIMPRIALVDAELCASVPRNVTAASGMDAITQLFESYISRKAQPIPQALAVQGLRLAVPAIVEAVENGSSRPARQAMSHAALLSGMALANSGLGMAHGVAPALGTHCRVPHGLACAVMLPVTLRVNSEVRQTELARLAHLLFGESARRSPAEAVEVLIDEMQKLCDRVGVPRRLSALGVSRQQIPAIVQDSRGSSMSGNPRELSDDALTAILEQML